MGEGSLHRWANLLYVLKYSLIFAILLLYLPLTALEAVPGFTLLGGLFLELKAWGLFWAGLGFFCTAWALMITTALLVDGAEKDLPPRAAAFFRLPIEPAPFLTFTALGAWGCGLTAFHAHPDTTGVGRTVAPVAAFVVAYLLLHFLTFPARWADPDFRVFDPSRLGDALFRLCDARWLRRFFSWLRRLASLPFRWLRVKASLQEGEDGRPVLAPGHFFALTCLLGLLVILFTVGWIYFPPRGVEPAPPAAVFLYILLTLLVWTINGLEHNLAPIHVSPLVVLLLIFLVVYLPQDVDHYYPARHTEAPPELLTPVTVVEKSRRPETVVVIAASGGGILASGWMTLGLQRMIQDRPCLAEEIRLLSTVSGSSVGAAFYARTIREHPDLVTMDPAERGRLLGEIYQQSVASSLTSAAYGFAYLDFWRLFLGDGLPPLERWDRGLLLSNAWGRTAQAETLTVADLRPAIRGGGLPSVIFASTVMETGRRMMITPLDFEPLEVRDRASTLSEFLSPASPDSPVSPDRQAADLDLWNAARMSATFPFVSPAASARFENVGDDTPPGEIHWRYHLIDGGYFDNFGVTSALDWLEPVMQATLDEELPTKRIFILRITPFAEAREPTAPADGAFAALAGPLLGVLGTQGGIALSRNAIDLQRFLKSWDARFRDRGLEVRLGTAEIRPGGDMPEPLSWHLTPTQIATQEGLWPQSPDAPGAPSVTVGWKALKDFLADAPCSAQ